MLFVCGECGALGCGAITAAVSRDTESFTWSDFRHETNYEPPPPTRYEDIGPFTFAATEYRRVLGGTVAE
jgi:hypothetical protein